MDMQTMLSQAGAQPGQSAGGEMDHGAKMAKAAELMTRARSMLDEAIAMMGGSDQQAVKATGMQQGFESVDQGTGTA